LGEEKVKESLLRVLKAARILSLNYGRIYIEFGKTISLKQFALGYNKSLPCIKDDMPLRKKIIQDLAYEIVYIMLDKIVVMPTGMVSSILLMHRKGITEDMLVKKMEWLS
jgi:glycerol-3-phosphate O-acyltransferase